MNAMALRPQTYSARGRIQSRYTAYLKATHQPASETSAVRWLATLSVSPRSALTYAGHLQAILRPPSPLQRYKKGLQRIGVTTPIRQANPINRAHMKQILNYEPPRTSVPLWVAWKTASRWDDVSRLRRSRLSFVTRGGETMIVIDWGPFTKTSANLRVASHLLTVVAQSPHDGPFWNTALAFLRSLRPDQLITTQTTAQISRLLSRYGPLTAHSIKRGAITCALAEGADIALTSRLAKHSAPEQFSRTTLGYVQELPTIAIALGTQNVTRLL